MFEKNELYIGIDIDHEYAMISLYHNAMKEPRTISAVTGGEKYQIPTAVLIGKNNQIFYGEEALRRQEEPESSCYRNLYEHALQEQPDGDGIYHQCFRQFLQRLIRFKDRFAFGRMPAFLSLTVPELTADAVRLLQDSCEKLGFARGQYLLSDHRESFFEHTCHQEASIWEHGVLLFHMKAHTLCMWILQQKESGSDLPFYICQQEWEMSGEICEDPSKKDRFFAGILSELQKSHALSGIYLVGDGFTGEWMQQSLQVIAKHIRVFIGKNLFTRGACYGAFRRRQQPDWKYHYICSYQYSADVSVMVMQNGQEQELLLAKAGENWFDGADSLRFLYGGTPQIKVNIQKAGEETARVDTISLDGIPERDPGSVRLQMQILPKSREQIIICITEDGFGELFAPSGKVWTHEIAWKETESWER